MGNFCEPGGGSFCRFLDFQISHGDQTCLKVVVNFLSQIISTFLLFLGMLMYANED